MASARSPTGRHIGSIGANAIQAHKILPRPSHVKDQICTWALRAGRWHGLIAAPTTPPRLLHSSARIHR
jgi:hypothetical protein